MIGEEKVQDGSDSDDEPKRDTSSPGNGSISYQNGFCNVERNF